MRLLRVVWAALRELTGEADYDRYRRRHRGACLTPGEYWLARCQHDEGSGTRCC